MAFRVFISHSIADVGLVYQLKYWLEVNGIETYLAELDQQLGMPLADKIKKAIDYSDCIIAVLTAGSTRSQWVNQEVGYAVKANKLVIPIKEEGAPVSGFIEGVEYIPLSIKDPAAAISRVLAYLIARKADKEAREKLLGAVLILVGLLALAAARERE